MALKRKESSKLRWLRDAKKATRAADETIDTAIYYLVDGGYGFDAIAAGAVISLRRAISSLEIMAREIEDEKAKTANLG